MEIRELQVPTAWGHIAIKAWGDPKNEIIIVLHGLLDNAASFDTLLPLLPQDFYYLCVDFPGHGLSSHFPPDLPMYVVSYLHVVRIVVDHFRRHKYILLGHSLGGRVAVLFAQTFPQLVSKIVILDGGYATVTTPQDYVFSLRKSYDTIKKIASNTPKSSFPYKEIVQKIIDGRLVGTLTFEAAEQLAKRMISKIGDDKYVFTYDRRVLTMIYTTYTKEYISEMLNQYPITCPGLSVYTNGTNEIIESNTGVNDFFHIPNFQTIEVQGHHHSHHTNPEIFAPILTKFLLEQRNKL